MSKCYQIKTGKTHEFIRVLFQYRVPEIKKFLGDLEFYFDLNSVVYHTTKIDKFAAVTTEHHIPYGHYLVKSKSGKIKSYSQSEFDQRFSVIFEKPEDRRDGEFVRYIEDQIHALVIEEIHKLMHELYYGINIPCPRSDCQLVKDQF